MNSLTIPAIAALSGLLAATTQAAMLNSETFDILPSPIFWKLDSASVANGKLVLDGIGDETVFVNASIETASSRAELNFAHAPLVITLDDLELGGLAPIEKQAFVLHLGSDRAGGGRAGYVRLSINGTGNAVLTMSGPKIDGRVTDIALVNRPVTLPIRKIVLALDRQGYRLDLTDAFAPGSAAAPWSGDVDWAQWETAVPYLFIKAVRRPSPGTCEVRIGNLTIDSSRAVAE